MYYVSDKARVSEVGWWWLGIEFTVIADCEMSSSCLVLLAT